MPWKKYRKLLIQKVEYCKYYRTTNPSFYTHAENHEAESWRLDDTVQKEIDKLKDAYADIATEACECLLETRKLSAPLAAVWLNDILRGTQNEPLLVEESVSDCIDLFRKLQEKWSFTNPTLLQQLLKKLDNSSLIQQLDEYTERFNTFCSKFPIDKAKQPVCFEQYDSSQPCLVLILDFETFDNIKVFLKDVFDIYARYLRVHMITPGNIKTVSVQFPASMTTIVQDCIDQRRKAANDTSMHIKPRAEDTKKQPTAASSAKYQTSEAAVHDMDNEPKMREVTKQIPANMEQLIPTSTQTTEPKTEVTEPSVPTMPNA